MKVLTASQMKGLDDYAIRKLGIPGLTLMENAGRAVYESCLDILKKKLKGKRVFVICGRGNNGGDGFVAARHLFNNAAFVKTFLIGSPDDLKGDALTNYKAFVKYGGRVETIKTGKDIMSRLVRANKPNLIVDAIFGTGLKDKIKGFEADVIGFINKSGAKVLSVDIPSGLDADAGLPLGVAVVADLTVTFGYPKLGLVIGESYKYVGDLIVRDISLPKIYMEEADSINLISPKMAGSLFRPRPSESHKGANGHVLIVAGSREKSGAAKLSAITALRGGAGLVTLAIPEGAHDLIKKSLFNVMSLPVPDDKRGSFTAIGIEKIMKFAKDKNVVAIGPGLNKGKCLGDLIVRLINKTRIPLVVDADGLNSISGRLKEIKGGREGVVFTPHPGEMSRLTGKSTGEIRKNRLSAVKEFTGRYGIALILKGFRSIIGFRDGSIYINPTGNPGMATAGMGDILTGLISSYLAQQDNFKKGVLSAVFNHGLLGDLVMSEFGERGILATDLVNKLTDIQKTLYPSRKPAKIEEF